MTKETEEPVMAESSAPEKDTRVRKRSRKGGVPLGAYTAKMAIPEGLIPPDRVGRFINDVNNRIHIATNDDWDFVMATPDTHIGDSRIDLNSDVGGKISMIVGTDKGGSEIRAYLMMKWRDWYDEDQDKKQERNDDIDRAIKSPGFGADKKGLPDDQMYGSMKYKA